MTYANHSFSHDSDQEHEQGDSRRVSYSRGRSYRADRRRGRTRKSSKPGYSINGRCNRRWAW